MIGSGLASDLRPAKPRVTSRGLPQPDFLMQRRIDGIVQMPKQNRHWGLEHSLVLRFMRKDEP